MVTFSAHLSVTIKRLTRYKPKKSYCFAKKSKCPKIFPLNAFPIQISSVRSFLCALTIFGMSNTPSHCLKEALVTWPLACHSRQVSIFVKIATVKACDHTTEIQKTSLILLRWGWIWTLNFLLQWNLSNGTPLHRALLHLGQKIWPRKYPAF